jgi:hypothetical protein
MNMDLKLGVLAKDKITGFEGVVIAHAEYLHGCEQWCLKPQALHEGKPIDGTYIDAPQLEVIGEGPPMSAPAEAPGGPQIDTPRDTYRMV